MNEARIEQAAQLYEDFTGHQADQVDIAKIPNYDTALCIGECLGIMYETVRDGVRERYQHDFRKKSRPQLCITHDGRQILLIGGSYLFKDSGINDQ